MDIRSVSLWHITPADLGVEFFDPTMTTLEADGNLYALVNDPSIQLNRHAYSPSDYKAILYMRDFLKEVRQKISGDDCIRFIDTFPGITGCIAKYQVTPSMFCYIMVSGIVVFYEQGTPIPFDDPKYFSIPAFYERQVYEDDYCNNKEETPRKAPLYRFLRLLWKCTGSKAYSHSASDNFRNHGISYTLCITMVDIPGLVSNRVGLQLRKNFRALLDTSAFSNIYHTEQWDLIRERIDNDDISDLQLKELSETLVFADNWSGVLVAGDLEKNENCLAWLIEFEIFLQSQWLLFDAYSENLVRQDMSSMELQGILNRVEFVKVMLDNDISSNVEQSHHIMRCSLIASSDINTIYSKMHGIITNKLKLKLMSDDRKKARFSLLSDLSLLLIALFEIYGVLGELMTKTSFTEKDIITLGIMVVIAAVCIWFMVKGHE